MMCGHWDLQHLTLQLCTNQQRPRHQPHPVLRCGQKPGVHNRTETQRWPLGPQARAGRARNTRQRPTARESTARKRVDAQPCVGRSRMDPHPGVVPQGHDGVEEHLGGRGAQRTQQRQAHALGGYAYNARKPCKVSGNHGNALGVSCRRGQRHNGWLRCYQMH